MSPGQRQESGDDGCTTSTDPTTQKAPPPPRPSSPPPFAPQAFDLEDQEFEPPSTYLRQSRQLGSAFEPEGDMESESSEDQSDAQSLFSFEGPRRQPSSRYYKPQGPHHRSQKPLAQEDLHDSSIYFDYDDSDLDEELNVWDSEEDVSHPEDNLIEEANTSCAVSDDEFWFCDSPPPPRRQASLVYRKMNSVVTVYDSASVRSRSQKSTQSAIASIPE